jgi:hypothetical protein
VAQKYFEEINKINEAHQLGRETSQQWSEEQSVQKHDDCHHDFTDTLLNESVRHTPKGPS